MDRSRLQREKINEISVCLLQTSREQTIVYERPLKHANVLRVAFAVRRERNVVIEGPKCRSLFPPMGITDALQSRRSSDKPLFSETRVRTQLEGRI